MQALPPVSPSAPAATAAAAASGSVTPPVRFAQSPGVTLQTAERAGGEDPNRTMVFDAGVGSTLLMDPVDKRRVLRWDALPPSTASVLPDPIVNPRMDRWSSVHRPGVTLESVVSLPAVPLGEGPVGAGITFTARPNIDGFVTNAGLSLVYATADDTGFAVVQPLLDVDARRMDVWYAWKTGWDGDPAAVALFDDPYGTFERQGEFDLTAVTTGYRYGLYTLACVALNDVVYMQAHLPDRTRWSFAFSPQRHPADVAATANRRSVRVLPFVCSGNTHEMRFRAGIANPLDWFEAVAAMDHKWATVRPPPVPVVVFDASLPSSVQIEGSTVMRWSAQPPASDAWYVARDPTPPDDPWPMNPMAYVAGDGVRPAVNFLQGLYFPHCDLATAGVALTLSATKDRGTYAEVMFAFDGVNPDGHFPTLAVCFGTANAVDGTYVEATRRWKSNGPVAPVETLGDYAYGEPVLFWDHHLPMARLNNGPATVAAVLIEDRVWVRVWFTDVNNAPQTYSEEVVVPRHEADHAPRGRGRLYPTIQSMNVHEMRIRCDADDPATWFATAGAMHARWTAAAA